MTPKKETVPAVEETRPGLMERIEEHRKILVGLGIVVVILIVGVVLFRSLGRQAAEEDWYRLYSARTPFGSSADLEELATSDSADMRAHALYLLAQVSVLKGDGDAAVEALKRLENECGDTLFARLPSPDRRTPLHQYLLQRIESDLAWDEKYGFDEDPEVDDDRKALVETDHGAFWIGFFPDYAPKHVEAFIENAKKGVYNDTRFYLVTPTQLRFGGETTKDDDDFNDATAGSEVTYIDPDKGRFKIQHVRGMISAVPFDEGDSVAKLTIALDRASELDKRQTIFAAVLKGEGQGMTPLDNLRNAAVTYGTSDDPLHRAERFVELADHPVDPVRVTRISIWSKTGIEDGHDWDTSAVDAKAAEKPEEEEKPAEEPKEGETPEDGEAPEAGDAEAEKPEEK